MAILNSYPQKEHQTFKRTFLRQTEVIVKLTPAIADAHFLQRMTPYLKKTFNIDAPEGIEQGANHAELSSNQEQKKFVFDSEQARIIVGPNSYNTFVSTALPMIESLIKFLNEVARVEDISDLCIVKTNSWPFQSENAFDGFANILKYTFKEESVTDMLSYGFGDNPQPVKLSKTAHDGISDNIELNAVLSAEVSSKERALLGLTLQASAKNVKVTDIIQKALFLNDLIYQGFIATISDNIKDIMSRENLT